MSYSACPIEENPTDSVHSKGTTGEMEPAGNVESYQRPQFHLIGGNLALDFANTAGWHASDAPSEWLTGYPSLVAWSWQAGLLTHEEAHHLMEVAAQHPVEASGALQRALALRETIYRIFAATAHGRPPEASDVASFNAALAVAFDRLHVASHGAELVWAWLVAPDALDRMLWPIVRAAADLMTSEEHTLVRQCAGDPCGWLFLDLSRKHNRRWCSMADCGNRAKARRHRTRQKAAR